MKNFRRFCFVVFTLALFLSPGLVLAKESLATDFKLSDLSGKQVVLSSYRNKQPVILIFWASWCPFCRKELNAIGQMCQQIDKDGVQVLAINCGESKPKIESFLKTNNISFLVLMDTDTKVSQNYGVLGIPTYIFIDRKGYLLSESHVFSHEDYQKLLK